MTKRSKRTPAWILAGLLVAGHSSAGVVFEDDFDDGNADGWSFSGSYAADWSVVGGALVNRSSSGYIGAVNPSDPSDRWIGFATIDGLATPGRFTMEADVRITTYRNGPDFGHVGLGWGINDVDTDFNTLYLRTHQDRVTHFSYLSGVSMGEQFLNTSGVTNEQVYRLVMDVDYSARTMTTTLGSNSRTFTGTEFDRINQSSGGGIGLITWGDHLVYDNVRISIPDATVPAPGVLALIGLGFVGLGLGRRRLSAR